MHKYDIRMIGHISKDIMIYREQEDRFVGGPVIYSSMAAVKTGASVQVVTKAKLSDSEHLNPIRESGVNVELIGSPETTSIENIYLSEDRERRKVRLLSQAQPFTLDEIPGDPSTIYHLAGLFYGEIPSDLIIPLSEKGRVAIDAQGLLRCSEDGKLLFRNWEERGKYLPYISYLKTDAAEAEILTGEEDREKGAQMLCDLGADEVMVTHNSEVIICSKGKIYRAPLNPKNLSGRTGRGDTCFAAYLARRLTHGIDESLKYAAALVSMKMESPGPFDGTEQDVLARMATL